MFFRILGDIPELKLLRQAVVFESSDGYGRTMAVAVDES